MCSTACWLRYESCLTGLVLGQAVLLYGSVLLMLQGYPLHASLKAYSHSALQSSCVLHIMLVQGPSAGPPCCGVTSPSSCIRVGTSSTLQKGTQPQFCLRCCQTYAGFVPNSSCCDA